MDEASMQLSFLQSRSIFHQAEGLNHTGKSPVPRCLLFSLRKQKQQRDGACLLQSFIISVARRRMISAHNNLAALTWSFRMQNYRLGARRWPNASFPLLLLCRPLRCLMFAADSIITAVWEGIKRYVACSDSHLLNIQLHRTDYAESAGLADWTPKPVSVCPNLLLPLHFVPQANKKAALEWARLFFFPFSQNEINKPATWRQKISIFGLSKALKDYIPTKKLKPKPELQLWAWSICRCLRRKTEVFRRRFIIFIQVCYGFTQAQ